jgi:WD40 repeat protein
MAQETSWLDADHFAVGRWDGSLSIFKFNDSPTAGPVITQAVNTPAFEGVQMITWVANGTFASSNDDGSVVIWNSPSGNWTDLCAAATLQYDPSLGVANSAECFSLGSTLYLVIGHANGFLSIWASTTSSTSFQFQKSINLQNPNPTNPWGIHNIRGVSLMFSLNQTGYLVTGSEDGFLSVVSVPDGTILSQTVYNPKAQRGINSVAALGQNLLVANCAVGPSDNNLWYYWVDGNNWSVTLRAATNLRVNPNAPQVFNFSAIWGIFNQQVGFFSSTEEGALWAGLVSNTGLTVLGYQNVFGSLGSALAWNITGDLAVVNYNLYEFTTGSSERLPPGQHPERLEQRIL